jgi:4-diphosphocytidyl-2-C-methyl-D-erythritol kinase
MIFYPPAKINLGLHVLYKRDDGYHEIETCMVAIPWYDILEITLSEEFQFIQSGNVIASSLEENLCYKAYKALKLAYQFPNLRIHLRKQLPMGAGLGGGSADAAYVLKGINELCNLKISNEELRNIAATLGSDCPFFIENLPQLAKGRGELLSPLQFDLAGYWIKVINPGIHVSTKEAYDGVILNNERDQSISAILEKDIHLWKSELVNDFEKSVFKSHPQLENLKNELYKEGAVYAAMSGSGSTLFGLFEKVPNDFKYPEHFNVFIGLI